MIGFAFLAAHPWCIKNEMEQGQDRRGSQKAPEEAQMRDGYGLDQNDDSEYEEK